MHLSNKHFPVILQICIVDRVHESLADKNNNSHEVLSMSKESNDLLTLKNLGVASVNILHAVGVNSYEDLLKVGPVETYKRIKERDIQVSKVMLYALQGALLDTHWNDLEPDLKNKLLEEAGECQ
jgi:DNA transformation protein